MVCITYRSLTSAESAYIIILSLTMFVNSADRRDCFAQSSRSDGQRQRSGRNAPLRRHAQGAGNSILRARAFRAPHAGRGARFRRNRARKRVWRHHRRRGQGRASGRRHGGQHHAAGDRRAHQVFNAGRIGRAFVHRTDAAGHAGGDRGHRRGQKRRLAGRADHRRGRFCAGRPPLADRAATKAKIIAKDAQIRAEFEQE